MTIEMNFLPAVVELERPQQPAPAGAVTIERLERAVVIAAYIVARHGPQYAPIFERLERELAAAKAKPDTVDRARRLLESYTREGGRRPALL